MSNCHKGDEYYPATTHVISNEHDQNPYVPCGHNELLRAGQVSQDKNCCQMPHHPSITDMMFIALSSSHRPVQGGFVPWVRLGSKYYVVSTSRNALYSLAACGMPHKTTSPPPSFLMTKMIHILVGMSGRTGGTSRACDHLAALWRLSTTQSSSPPPATTSSRSCLC
eukprot:6209604-Pleurochrysis_carterae.AAC.3